MAKATLPALNSNNGCTGVNKSQFKCITKTKANAVIDVSLPLISLYATRLRIPEGIASAVQVNLPCCLLVASYFVLASANV